ncbi:hypothetical protein Tsubulata_016063 [Turnera subulata]|uniref:BHLH domain-containing protein n=1 Tax=Turnera subulata TaxID=218843 RepID=A0A9Q0J9N0_9ROSI|nr:hypothetical protein Tsubulata_016063 [Turnera subulata]
MMWPLMDQAFSGSYDSSLPEEASSWKASKNIVCERNRRKKLTDRMLALRQAVPKISKLDRASVIKDAIAYIQELHEQERLIQAEITQLELSQKATTSQELPELLRSRKRRISQNYGYGGCKTTGIEVLEFRVSYVAEKTIWISLSCLKRSDTIVKLCEVFESLKLKIISANISTFSGKFPSPWNPLIILARNTKTIGRPKCSSKMKSWIVGPWMRRFPVGTMTPARRTEQLHRRRPRILSPRGIGGRNLMRGSLHSGQWSPILMDKASIIKDAIEYIQELHEQERAIQAEIIELESGKSKKNPAGYDFEQELPTLLRPKKKKIADQIAYMGEKTVLVSLTCSKRTDTMVRLCEVFESLKLKIITANITTVSGRVLKTVFIEADEEEKDSLKIRIETAIAALNDPQSPMSI